MAVTGMLQRKGSLAGPMRVFDMWTGPPANCEADLPSFDVGNTAGRGHPIGVLN
jgi:hypothetical protein